MILTLVEREGERPTDLSGQALAFGGRLAGELGVGHHALLVGEGARAAAGVLRGVAVAHLAVHGALDEGAYAPRAWARALAEAARGLAPAAVVAAASDRGAEVMAHAAAMLDAPLAANCTAVEPSADGEAWSLTRQRWGGSLLEHGTITGPPRFLTVAPHAVTSAEPGGEPPEVRTYTPALDERDLLVRVVDRVEPSRDGVSLAEARVVVGGGRGVGGPEGFAALEELARLLGGAVGCSRVVTSNGWRPHADQIGQTGTRIAPDLYVACGISGATQHIVGCRGAKRILAINTDAEAPILAHADYAIVGDLREVVPAISAEIRRTLGG